MRMLRKARLPNGDLGKGILKQKSYMGNYNIDNISINIPEPVREILSTLHNAGYEAYIVGGCVRDSILGKVPGDWDITTEALPDQVKSLFKSTVDTGIKHGTVMVIKKGRGYEVTTFRIDGNYADCRHPDSVKFTRSLKEDLKRRDFTINAFAYSPEEGVIDLFDGISDLNRGLIRCVGDPEKRFSEDALRIMRAVRFSAQLSFDIEEGTAKAIEKFAPRLSKVSTERIRVEFEKTLLSENPEHVDLYGTYGLAPYIFPEVYGECFKEKNSRIFKEFGKESPSDLKFLRLAAFFEDLSYEKCRKTLKNFTYDNKTKETVSGIIKFKDFPVEETRASVKRAMRDMGLEIFVLVQKYDMARAKAFGQDTGRYEELLGISEDILSSKEPFRICDLAVKGNDLIEAGLPRGREIRWALESILEKVIDAPELNNKEDILKMIKRSDDPKAR